MGHDPDFAEPIAAKSGGPSRGTQLRLVWVGICLINMFVPTLLGLLFAHEGGLAGMLLGMAVLLWLGWHAAGVVPEVIRTVVYGACILAVVQSAPLLQIKAGEIGLAVSKHMGLATHHQRELLRVDTIAGGLMTTIITGGILIAMAGLIGLVGRSVGCLARRAGFGGIGWKSVATPKEA